MSRFARNLRQALRYWWWRQTGTAARLEREAREARANAAFRFDQYVRARDMAWLLKHPPTEAGGALLLAADEIDRQGPNSPCEDAWQEGDTGAWNCDRERRGEVCWCVVASELRDLEKALRASEEYNRDSGRRSQSEGPSGAEAEGWQSGAPKSAHRPKPSDPKGLKQ